MTELERAEETTALSIPGVLSPTGLRLPNGLQLEEWIAIGDTLKAIGQGYQWWVGDWLLYGEHNYGEEFSQALDRADHTFDNWKWVSRSVDVSRRREDLSFSHHAEVAKLPPSAQERVLEQAAREVLGVRQTRELVAQEIQEQVEEEHGKAEVVEVEDCPYCDGTGKRVVE